MTQYAVQKDGWSRTLDGSRICQLRTFWQLQHFSAMHFRWQAQNLRNLAHPLIPACPQCTALVVKVQPRQLEDACPRVQLQPTDNRIAGIGDQV